MLLELQSGLSVVKVKTNNLREQGINACTMPATMFRQLISNIEDRGALESLPFCAMVDGEVEIVSGHHRKRAASAAGMEDIIVLLDTTGLNKDQIRAKQLAHNSINGTDDIQIVKQIYEMIQDAEAKIESFIDPKDLEIEYPDRIPIIDIMDSNMGSRTVMFAFLGHQSDNFEEVIGLINDEVDEVDVVDREHFEKFREAIVKVKDIDNIRAVGMIVSKMCDIVLEHYEQQDNETVDERGETT